MREHQLSQTSTNSLSFTREEIFKQKIKKLTNDTYEVAGIYQNSRTPLLMKHVPCQTEWEVTPSYFIQGKRCPNCHPYVHLDSSREAFYRRLETVGKGEYEAIGIYKNAHTPLLIRHHPCQTQWEVTPSYFFQKKRCPHCQPLKRTRRTPEMFQNEVEQLVGDSYQILQPFVTTNHRIRMKHLICGHEWVVLPYAFLNGSRCPRCARRRT